MRSLRTQLYVSCLGAMVIAVVSLGWYVAETLKRQAYLDATESLEHQATLLAEFISRDFATTDGEALQPFCESMSSALMSRVTVSNEQGRVLADSHEDPARMDNHAYRPEIRQALAGTVGKSERYSETLNSTMVYVASPIRSEGRLVGIVRVSRPVRSILGSVEGIYRSLILAVIIVMAVAAFPTVYVSLRITDLIRQLEDKVKRLVKGDLGGEIEIPQWREVQGLARAMNQLTELMGDRLSALNRQRQELEAVLGSMLEAVIMIDNEQRIINMNRAAQRLFKPRVREFAGRNFMEVMRNIDLQSFVERALKSEEPIEEDLVIIGQPDMHLQAHGAALLRSDGMRIGTLIVLNNITRLKTLEQTRRDLVTNASHELRTPVTSIKGFLETLRDGAIDEPETARRFLGIMIRQTDRLVSIIEDMLKLSEIERAQSTSGVRLERIELSGLLDAVKREFLPMAQEKQIQLEVQCEYGLTAMVNEHLFHQAIVNLVDNAIKYTQSGGRVKVWCSQENGRTAVCVEDNGIGIPREHQARIFERFYRVDAGRSRKMGGTGLGLAIVKHIVSVHGGEVSVESSPGRGSRFCIRIPATSDVAKPALMGDRGAVQND